MSDENAVQLSAEEARSLYVLLVDRGEAPDSVFGRLLGKLEAFLYRTMTIGEIEMLRQTAEGRPGRGPVR